MPRKRSAHARSNYVAAGYGLKIYVERGHLVVHDGIGRDRKTERFSRATSGLKRIVVVGHTGFVTLEALRWIRDVGAAFVQVDRDGSLIAVSAPERRHEAKLRRAQALAPETRVGRLAMIQLLRAKLLGQVRIARRFSHLRPVVRVKNRNPITVVEAIEEQIEALSPKLSMDEMRKLESMAGRYYWQTLAGVPVAIHRSWRNAVPEHWHFAGRRISTVDEKRRPRKASTPFQAMLNYSYAILETEAIIAAHKLGFDPSLGILHANKRYRSNFAIDLMEAVLPVCDELVLSIVRDYELRRGDVVETREGVCRIGPPMARRLGANAPILQDGLAPYAEQLARTLLADPDHPTPLTRRKHHASMGR